MLVLADILHATRQNVRQNQEPLPFQVLISSYDYSSAHTITHKLTSSHLMSNRKHLLIERIFQSYDLAVKQKCIENDTSKIVVTAAVRH